MRGRSSEASGVSWGGEKVAVSASMAMGLESNYIRQ